MAYKTVKGEKFTHLIKGEWKTFIAWSWDPNHKESCYCDPCKKLGKYELEEYCKHCGCRTYSQENHQDCVDRYENNGEPKNCFYCKTKNQPLWKDESKNHKITKLICSPCLKKK